MQAIASRWSCNRAEVEALRQVSHHETEDQVGGERGGDESRPDVDVEENDLTLTVRVRVGKVRPLDMQLLLSPDAMVIQAEHNATAKRMFRTVQFPRRIDVAKVEVKYEDGCLILTA